MNIVDDGDLPQAVHGLAERVKLNALKRHHSTRGVMGLYVLVNSAITIAILSGIAVLTHEPFVFPSLGPTAFVLFFAATSVSSCPRNVFCGHLIGVLCGFAALTIFGLNNTPPDLESLTWAQVGSITLALCSTLSLMVWLGVAHAPAGATTLIVALGLLRTPGHLVILMVAVAALIAQGFVINRLAGIKYPVWAPADPSSAR